MKTAFLSQENEGVAQSANFISDQTVGEVPPGIENRQTNLYSRAIYDHIICIKQRIEGRGDILLTAVVNRPLRLRIRLARQFTPQMHAIARWKLASIIVSH